MSKMTKRAAARIQSSEAKTFGTTSSNSFAARAQRAANNNQPKSTPRPPNWPSKVPGKPSGGGRDNNPPRSK